MPTECWTADSCRLDPACAFVWECRTVADPEEEEMAPRTRNTPEPAQPAEPQTQATPDAAQAPAEPSAPPAPPVQPSPAAPTVQQAAQRRGDAMANVKDGDRNMVDALLAERAGYVQRKLDDQAAEVDEQLRLRGYRTA